MSVDVRVGFLAYALGADPSMAAHLRADLEVVNAVLAKNKLPAFAEPEHLPALRSRSDLQNLGYSHLGGPKRIYAYAAKYPDWWPTPPADGLRVYMRIRYSTRTPSSAAAIC